MCRWAAEDVSPVSHAAFLEVDVATGYFLSQPESNKAVRKAQAQDMPMLIDVKATPSAMYWQFTHVSTVPYSTTLDFNYVKYFILLSTYHYNYNKFILGHCILHILLSPYDLLVT